MSMIKKALGTLIREALQAKGWPVIVFVDPQVGALRYEIGGLALSPGEAAKALGIEWE